MISIEQAKQCARAIKYHEEEIFELKKYLRYNCPHELIKNDHWCSSSPSYQGYVCTICGESVIKEKNNVI